MILNTQFTNFFVQFWTLLHTFGHFLLSFCTFLFRNFWAYTFCPLLHTLNIFELLFAPFLLKFWNPKGVVPDVLKQVANLLCLQWIYEKDFFLWSYFSVFSKTGEKALSLKNNILTDTRKQHILNIFVWLLWLQMYKQSPIFLLVTRRSF